MSQSGVLRWMGAVIVLALVLGAGFFAGRKTVKRPGPVPGNEVMDSSDDREVLYWRAPMNPAEIYDQPGKSAMGMDLVPVYKDLATVPEAGAVQIDPSMAHNMGVRTQPALRMDFAHSVRTVGEVHFNEETLYIVSAKISGWVETLHVDYEGQAVDEGAPMLEIYSPELVTTQQDFLLALRAYQKAAERGNRSLQDDAMQLLESARARLANWDIPQAAVEKLESSGVIQKTVPLHAPTTGVVIDKDVVQGAYINAGDNLYRIADLSTVWVHASVYERDIAWLSVGLAATMELSQYPGRTYRGRISYIYPFFHEGGRYVHARLQFANPDGILRPGMYVNLVMERQAIPDAVAIPAEAVLRSGDRNIVFVRGEPGKYLPRAVEIGEEGGPGGRHVRVMQGLSEGEHVVVSAQFLIDSESRLQEALDKMRSAAPDTMVDQDTMGVPEAAGMAMPHDHQH